VKNRIFLFIGLGSLVCGIANASPNDVTKKFTEQLKQALIRGTKDSSQPGQPGQPGQPDQPVCTILQPIRQAKVRAKIMKYTYTLQSDGSYQYIPSIVCSATGLAAVYDTRITPPPPPPSSTSPV